MNVLSQRKIVLLGMMSRMPVAGNIWLVIQYMLGFKRLGYDPYYVEAHAVYPGMLMNGQNGDASTRVTSFLADVLGRFGFGDRWAFHALHAEGACYGMSLNELQTLYRSAALILNLHGGTEPLADHAATGRLIFVGTDPCEVEIELYDNRQKTIDFMAAHSAFFTWGENYRNADCKLPVSERFHFKPTRAPVICDLWQDHANSNNELFTTIGNWDQTRRHKDVIFQGETYTWSKHHEFLKVLDVPRRSGQRFELALSLPSINEEDRQLLESKGWQVRDALSFSSDLDAYRAYVCNSRGEFTVAKDQNVRLRSGWFSERSAQYLAAGRPVITQETGFSNILPTGTGLFGFSTLDEILDAVERINSDYARQSQAAADIARACFNYDVVLTKFLADLGLETYHAKGAAEDKERGTAFPDSLVLSPTSRWPTRLPQETIDTVLAKELPSSLAPRPSPLIHHPSATIIMVTCNELVYTRLALESLLAHTGDVSYEIIVIDNGSADETVAYLRGMLHLHGRLSVIFNPDNHGFARATNQGFAQARGETLVLLNNDTLPPPRLAGWPCPLRARSRHRIGRSCQQPRWQRGPDRNELPNPRRVAPVCS